MLGMFCIKINTTQEMRVARGVLEALGYPLFCGFKGAKDMDGFAYIQSKEAGDEVARGHAFGIHPTFSTLQDFLNAHFPPSAAQLELTRLEAEVAPLNARIAVLKELV